MDQIEIRNSKWEKDGADRSVPLHYSIDERQTPLQLYYPIVSKFSLSFMKSTIAYRTKVLLELSEGFPKNVNCGDGSPRFYHELISSEILITLFFIVGTDDLSSKLGPTYSIANSEKSVVRFLFEKLSKCCDPSILQKFQKLYVFRSTIAYYIVPNFRKRDG